MSTSSTGSGGDFLTRKSDVTKLRKALPPLSDVLVVDDERFDVERLTATLRVMFGYELEIRRASTLASALDLVIQKMPEIIFLDDVLKPSDTALNSIPFLRHAKYEGPIVVISGQVTRARRNELAAAGATDVIHKDDVESVRLAEALLRVFSTSLPEDVSLTETTVEKPKKSKSSRGNASEKR
jgi:DNA-binding NarL/FixJ family response regulator